jgi:hypothetical protein
MFKVTSEPQFTHTVKVRSRLMAGFKESTFKVRFRVIPMDELKAGDDDGRRRRKLSCARSSSACLT